MSSFLDNSRISASRSRRFSASRKTATTSSRGSVSTNAILLRPQAPPLSDSEYLMTTFQRSPSELGGWTCPLKQVGQLWHSARDSFNQEEQQFSTMMLPLLVHASKQRCNCTCQPGRTAEVLSVAPDQQNIFPEKGVQPATLASLV